MDPARAFVILAVLAAAAGCGSSSSGDASPTHSTHDTAAAPSVKIVAIGDSDATGEGDPTSQGWVGRYAGLVKARLHMPVTVDNRAQEGLTSQQLSNAVAGDPSLRPALASADIVLIGVGGADLNAGDEELGAALCKGKECYAQILHEFDGNIGEIAAEVHRLAPSAVLRAMSLPNALPGAGDAIPAPSSMQAIGRYQARSEQASVCRAVRSNGGECVDVLTAFNGPDGMGDAYAPGLMTKDPCCYPSGDGQQLIAKLLLATGLGDLPHAS